MNERIKLLAEQAGVKYSLWVGSKPAAYMTYDELEKFAELIVRECAQVCRNQPNIYALKADRDNCAIAIEEHFGVEE
jgi:hypothetical protein